MPYRTIADLPPSVRASWRAYVGRPMVLTVSIRLAGAPQVTKVSSVPIGKAMPSPAGTNVSVDPVESVTVALYSSKTSPPNGERRRVSSRSGTGPSAPVGRNSPTRIPPGDQMR